MKLAHYATLIAACLSAAISAYLAHGGQPLVVGGVSVFSVVLTVLALFQAPPTLPKSPSAPSRGFVSMRTLFALTAAALSAVVLAAWLSACGLFSAVAPAVVDCGSRIDQDAAKGMTFPQIVADVVEPCGMDAAAVLVHLLASKDPATLASPARAEALHMKALFVDAGAE